MKHLRLILTPLAMLCWCAHAPAATTGYWLEASAWGAPRSGLSVVRLPGLAEALADYLRNPERVFTIRYPAGEDGQLWAEELRAWLVALGMESARIELTAGSGREDAVAIELIASGQ